MSYSRTRNQIIISALKKVRAISLGETPSPDMVSEASDALNDIVKSQQISSHIKLWKEEWKTQTLTASSVVKGSDDNYYRCIKGHTSDADNKPVTGANYAEYWVLDTGKTGNNWVTATAYTTIAEFAPGVDTINIKKAFYRDSATGYDYALELASMREYFLFTDKRWESYPRVLVFHELPTPICYIYPHPLVTTYTIHYLKEVALNEISGATGILDFPDRWIKPLIWTLSSELASQYGLSLNERLYLDKKAEAEVLTASKGEFRGTSIGQFEQRY